MIDSPLPWRPGLWMPYRDIYGPNVRTHPVIIHWWRENELLSWPKES